MKSIAIFFAVVFGAIIYGHQSLQSGKVLRYIDEHPQGKKVPTATYYIGQGYYLFQNLQEATTYFLRVAQRYPTHPLGDDAYFYYLQCLEDTQAVPRAQRLEGYLAYLERYPEGRHAKIVQVRADNYRTGSGGN